MSAPGGLDPLRARLVALLTSGSHPAAPGQRQMLAAVRDGRSPHVDLVAARVDGPVDHTALRRALDGLVRAHEALRTHFTDGPEPRMVVRPPEPAELVLGATTGPEDAARHAQALLATPLDVRTPAPHRALLLTSAPDSHVLLAAVPHLLFDDHSHGVYLRDLATLLRGAEPPARGAYRDHAVEQAALLADGSAVRRRAAALAPPLPAATWPNTPERRSYRQRVLADHWSAHWVDQATRNLATRGATLTMACAAGWAAALHAVTGLDDVRIGTSLANRSDPAHLGTIGLFATMSVLRLTVSGRDTAGELLAKARRAALAALADGHVPLAPVLAELRGAHPGFRASGLFEATLAVTGHHPVLDAGPGVALHPVDGFDVDEGARPAFQPAQLAVRVGAPGEGVEVRLGHDRDLLDPGHAEAMARLLRAFLLADPARTVADLAEEALHG
ncbi:condensation domain-containing protein [Actinosynnema mirum]|uniref:Condensation domain protein n=1 Tax=Actinosynnema mirum (strain ATCC 29888 / DSM 43827 / JCM 3225 / NBRC 14064 / NCIMB 13271 / NRRL B-12336 / IMRU 3971 / 101) TaxID=446462 RepID=C6WQQ0_ACTMD|nr:condensation domain-containing protein [Actinosynnema mirum]ACU38740.1 condensation domain protein [Actinosynnema mirum DSM 43827]